MEHKIVRYKNKISNSNILVCTRCKECDYMDRYNKKCKKLDIRVSNVFTDGCALGLEDWPDVKIED